MQKIPCDVLAYRRFSIFFLQFRQRKQPAQKASSPVRIARSSILFPQALQLYVQLLHMREPSPRSSRLASQSRRVPQVPQRKQSRCQRLPTKWLSVPDFKIYERHDSYRVPSLFHPQRSVSGVLSAPSAIKRDYAGSTSPQALHECISSLGCFISTSLRSCCLSLRPLGTCPFSSSFFSSCSLSPCPWLSYFLPSAS